MAARLGERQAVDEVLQEVSLAAVRPRTRSTRPGSRAGCIAWRSARRCSIGGRGVGSTSSPGRYARKVRDEGRRPPDPLGWLLLDERLALVREALGKLPARDAEILLLKYTENWSCRDLAQHLGQTEAAIESRLHRARGRLRDELAGSNVIEVRR